ncbi:MAG: hypothetical protein AAF772_08960 [Acidobacteriota bacterium]
MSIDRTRVKALSQPLIDKISKALGVPERPVRFRLTTNAFYARTTINWPPEPAIVTISEESLNDLPVLAHELTHCLVPTRSLLLAEGFATWIGCETRGDCSDFFFQESTVDDAMRAHLDALAPIRELAAEFPGARRYFDVAESFRDDVRLAYLTAASFVKWCTVRHPALPAKTAQRENDDPVALLQDLSGQTLDQLERAWRASLVANAASQPSASA